MLNHSKNPVRIKAVSLFKSEREKYKNTSKNLNNSKDVYITNSKNVSKNIEQENSNNNNIEYNESKSNRYNEKKVNTKSSKKSEKIGLKIQQVHSRGFFSVACRIKARIPAKHHK